LTYPSEKYKFVNGKDDIPYEMENKTSLKPPIRKGISFLIGGFKDVLLYFLKMAHS
jgi:hypothetical protein